MMAESSAFLGGKIYLSIPECGISFGFEVAKLEGFVTLGGGQLVHTPQKATHTVAWHMQQPGIRNFIALSTQDDGPKLCSLIWFFACMDANELLPHGHPLYTPFPDKAIPGEAGPPLKVCVTGFMARWRVMVQMFTTCMGVTFRKDLHPTGKDKDNVLVASDLNAPSRKLIAAQDHHIPAVTLQWIIDSLQQWKVLPTEPYTTPADVSIVFRTPPLLLLMTSMALFGCYQRQPG